MPVINDILTAGVSAVAATTVDPQPWITTLAPLLPQYNILSRKQIAAFLGQVAVESEYFQIMEEDLNYTSEERLMRVYPHEFPTHAMARTYINRPQAIANRVYAYKLGNGGEASGDGWAYRGSGLIQLTGRDMHMHYATWKGASVTNSSPALRTIAGAAESACWFWQLRNLNEFADMWDITEVTRIVTGGGQAALTRLTQSNNALHAIGP